MEILATDSPNLARSHRRFEPDSAIGEPFGLLLRETRAPQDSPDLHRDTAPVRREREEPDLASSSPGPREPVGGPEEAKSHGRAEPAEAATSVEPQEQSDARPLRGGPSEDGSKQHQATASGTQVETGATGHPNKGPAEAALPRPADSAPLPAKLSLRPIEPSSPGSDGKVSLLTPQLAGEDDVKPQVKITVFQPVLPRQGLLANTVIAAAAAATALPVETAPAGKANPRVTPHPDRASDARVGAGQPTPAVAGLHANPTAALSGSGAKPVQDAANPGQRGGQSSATDSRPTPLPSPESGIGKDALLPQSGISNSLAPTQLEASTKVPGAAMLHARTTSGAARAAEQIAVHIHKAVGAGQDRINIQLRPPELGRIEVKFELADSRLVHVVITADRPETLDLLQRDVRGLERALQDAGLSTDSGSLNFSLRGDHRQERAARVDAGSGQADADPGSFQEAHQLPASHASQSGLGGSVNLSV